MQEKHRPTQTVAVLTWQIYPAEVFIQSCFDRAIPDLTEGISVLQSAGRQPVI